MTDFLYWPGDRLDSAGSSRADSPFWDAIKAVKTGSETLRIACPYLAPSYLESVVEDGEGWRLVTDVQAWTRVYGGEKETRIRDFIDAHRDRIRHYPGLHAKAVIGGESAVFGSANLTQNGMIERQELGVKVSEADEVADLQDWFEDVWAAGKQIGDGVLPSGGEREGVREYEEGETDEVFERLGEAPSRAWVESLLDVMREAIHVAQLGEGDPRLVTSAAQDDRVVVTVNSRYVCGGFFDGGARVGFILADDVEGVDTAVKRGVTGEYYRFSTRDGRDPHWVEFERFPEDALSQGVRSAWTRGVEREVERGTRSQYLDHHDGRVYRVIMDEEYRGEVLDSVF